MDIESIINEIGEDMVRCTKNCKGILNDKANGIIPRCLFYQNKPGDEGCVIVGINPGRSANNETEKDAYLKGDCSYQSTVDYWRNNLIEKEKYYKYLSKFLNCLKYNGPVLWTELVKCENAEKINTPPLQTFRNCANEYLVKEINCIPSNWPIIAVGREAHKVISYMFPNRAVLGIPHPTSSRGHFAKLFTSSPFEHLTTTVQNKINEFYQSTDTEIWLTHDED